MKPAPKRNEQFSDNPRSGSPPPPYSEIDNAAPSTKAAGHTAIYSETHEDTRLLHKPDTGCSLCKRIIKKPAVAAAMVCAGAGALLASIALSPFFGAYIVAGLVFPPGGCFCIGIDGAAANVLAVMFLGAVAIFSLPVIIASPVFALAAAHRTGEALGGDDFHSPEFLKWANHKAKYILCGDGIRTCFHQQVRHATCCHTQCTCLHTCTFYEHHRHSYRCWSW